MNSSEAWIKLMLTMPDQLFFEIVRVFLGKIQTPFQKHDLISKLEAFFTKPENRSRILAMIEKEDAEILSAVLILGSPSPAELFSFFKKEKPSLELHHRVLNLEYRLLIITDKTEKGAVIRINPLLEESIVEHLSKIEVLFPSKESPIQNREIPWLQVPLILAFLSFFSKESEVLKNDGSLKKRTLDELKQIFPVLDESGPMGSRFDLVLNSCTAGGLIKIENSKIIPRWAMLDNFAPLPQLDFLMYFWANAMPGHPHFHFTEAAVLKQFILSLPTGRAFTQQVLERMVNAIITKQQRKLASSRVFIELSAALGILQKTDNWYIRTEILTYPLIEGDPPCIIQPNHQVTIKPNIPLRQAVPIIQALDIQNCNIYTTYELSQTGVSRILKNGITGKQLISNLEETTKLDLPQNIAISIQEWENKYSRITLYEGIILKADEDIRHLVEHSPKMKEYIRAVLQPGIYLLARSDMDAWKNALHAAGVEQIPHIISFDNTPEEKDDRVLPPPPLPDEIFAEAQFVQEENSASLNTFREQIFQELFQKLTELSVAEEKKKEIKAMIRRGIIINSSQITPETVERTEKREAKGIDYLGKVRLAEQAIQSGNEILEVIERTGSGEPRRLLVKPVELDKSGSDLSLIAYALPGEEPVKISIRKLSLVRKLKSALFAP